MDDAWEDEASVKSEGSSPPSIRRRTRRGKVLRSPGPKKPRSTRRAAPVAETLVLVDEKKIPSADKPHLPPEPSSSVNNLHQFPLFVFQYTCQLAGILFRWLQYPLAFLLFLYVLVYILAQISAALHATIVPIVRPVCWLPFLSDTPLCLSTPHAPQDIQCVDYPRLMEVQSETFEKLLDNAVGGSTLSLEIKKGQMAADDLSKLVHLSDLSSKKSLGTFVNEFGRDARTTSIDLQKFSSKITGAVDKLIAVNDYALSTIQSADRTSTLEAIIPWANVKKKSNIITAFTASMETMNAELKRLIIQAQISLQNLNNLEEKLDTINEIVSREEKSVKSAHSDLLAELWSFLGGNRKELRAFEDNLKLLQDLSTYRQKARVHVVGALQTLHATQADVEELRERVAAPNLAGGIIPVEVHMKAIQSGLKRLSDGRIAAERRSNEALRNILPSDEN